MEILKDEFISLKNRIWKSYKSRINCAERLKNKNEFVAFLSIYYSAILSAVSILDYANKSEKMEVFTIVMSVMVTILFLYFEGRNYKERYIKMKENYNDLNLLYYKVESLIKLNEMSKENFDLLTEKYIELLNSVENHLEKDFLKYSIHDKEVALNCGKVIKYYFDITIIWLFKVIMVIIPTVVLLISLSQLLV